MEQEKKPQEKKAKKQFKNFLNARRGPHPDTFTPDIDPVIETEDFAFDEKHNLIVVSTGKVDVQKVIDERAKGVGIYEVLARLRVDKDTSVLHVRDGFYGDERAKPSDMHETQRLLSKGAAALEELQSLDKSLEGLSAKQLLEKLDDKAVDALVANKLGLKIEDNKE